MNNKEFINLIERLFNDYLKCKRFEVGAMECKGYFEFGDNVIIESEATSINYEYEIECFFVSPNSTSSVFKYSYLLPFDTLTKYQSELDKDPTYTQYLKKIRQESLKECTNFLFNYISFNKFVDDTFNGTLG